MANKQSPSDLLNQVEYWASSPESPLLLEVRKQLAPLEQKAAGLDEKSPEFQKLNADYQRQAAALLLQKMQAQFGGAIPDRKGMEDADFKQRSGGDPAVEKQLRESSKDMPFARGYSVLEELQRIANPNPKASTITEPGKPTPVSPSPRPSQPPKLRGGKPAETDDERLTETQLLMLYNLAGGGGPDPTTFDEADQPRPWNPIIPSKTVPENDPKTTPREQQLMDNYSKAFEAHEMGDSKTYAKMPLPPGWVRSPEGKPLTEPESPMTPDGDIEKAIRTNMYRLLMQQSGALKD